MNQANSRRFLVTAGNTRELIDRVRDWGNIFTGNTGRSIATALASRGDVDLLTSNLEHARELADHPKISVSTFRSHADLRELLRSRLAAVSYSGIFMTAAVADYAPDAVFEVQDRKTLPDGRETWTVRNVHAGKVKSHYDAIAVLGRRTEKLVDLFRSQWGYTGLLVKFKLEVGISEDQLVQIAAQSRTASGADFIVANTLEMVTGGNAGAYVIGPGTQRRIPRAELAEFVAALADVAR